MVAFVTLNGSRVNPASGVCEIDCCELVGGDPEDRAPWGWCPNLSALGVSALPYPPSEDGKEFAQGVVLENVGGFTGVILGGRDSRCASVYGKLSPGDTCLHSTGPGYDSIVLLKEQLASIMVGNDCIITIDRAQKAILICGFGHTFEMSEANGVLIGEKGGAALILKDGTAWLKGTSIMLSDNPAVPLATSALAPSTCIVGS